MCVELFVLLLLAHVIGDFYLQTKKMCEGKNADQVFSIWMYIHAMIITVLSWLVIFDFGFRHCAGILLISHFVLDSIKSYSKDTIVAFIVDQIAHVVILVLIACLWHGKDTWTVPSFMYVNRAFWPEYILAIAILVKPSNILIKKILKVYHLSEEESNNIGSLIGSLERLITFVLIVAGQFSAVGFLVAAKSILRFKDTQTEKTEYVLAGTLLSFGIAIAVGMIVHYKLLWRV